MKLYNTPVPSQLQVVNGGIMRVKRVAIGAWDMDTDANVQFAHGVTRDNILAISAMIVNDDDTLIVSIEGERSDGSAYGGIVFGGANITLYRTAGGWFDSVDYDDGVMNRGYVTIFYLI